MATTIGPLLSLSAAGSLGKGAITYRRHRGKTIVEHRSKQPIPTSPAQLANQAHMTTVNKYWSTMPAYAKKIWETTNFNLKRHFPKSQFHPSISGRLLYTHYNYPRIAAGLQPYLTPYNKEVCPLRHTAKCDMYEIKST